MATWTVERVKRGWQVVDTSRPDGACWVFTSRREAEETAAACNARGREISAQQA